MKKFSIQERQKIEIGEIIKVNDDLCIMLNYGQCTDCRFYGGVLCDALDCPDGGFLQKITKPEKIKAYDFPVGHIFEFQGEIVQLVDRAGCTNCYYFDKVYGCGTHQIILCEKNARKDKKNVSFDLICHTEELKK